MPAIMHSAVRNRRQTSPAEKLASVGAGVLGTVLLLAAMLALFAADKDAFVGDSYAATTEAAVIDLKTSCKGDVLLAMSARAALCVAPWRDTNPEQCGDDALMMMWMDLSSCEAKTEPSAAVAMTTITPRELEKVDPIDPEPLLEELMQQQKPPEPPKPVPPPQPQQPPPPPPPAPKPPPPPQRPKQVVEVAKSNTEQEPDDARFLSEQNVKVDKQKVARGARNEPMVAKSKPEELTAKKDPPKDDPSMQKPPEKPPGKNPNAPDNPNTLAMRPPGTPSPSTAPQDEIKRGVKGDTKQPIVSDGFVPRRGDGAIEQSRKDPGELTKGQGGGGGGTPQVPNLKPTKEQLERIVGGGSVDHLEDVENGDETALSAKRWVYASFFNRMKRQVAQNWDPQTVWRRIDPDGTHNGTKTRVTEVRVTLTAKGELTSIVVTKGSDVKELDDEAVRSFHASAPFPNPPEGLAKDGKITFAFSFFFEIGQRSTSWRVIRGN
jgi:TonB family protein